MKLFWFNDTNDAQVVYGPTFNEYLGTVQPQTGQFFEIKLEEGSIPFIKTWPNGQVLLSTMTAPD